MRIKKYLLGIIAAVALMTVVPAKAQAAAGLNIEETSIVVPYQGANAVTIDYTGYFSDLAVVVGDNTKVVTTLTDKGNGKAVLAIGSVDFGQTMIAVCKLSDTSVVDYLQVYSGLTNGNEINNYINGSEITTVYNDCVIRYDAILKGNNQAQASVTGLVLSRKKGMDELNVTANILKDDALMPGLATFNASFYDINNNLIRTQEAFIRTKLGIENNICWYIPEECVTIILN